VLIGGIELVCCGPDFAATFSVTSTNDSGAGSLREAINNGNTNAEANQIIFDIPGPGLQTISPASDLPVVTNALVLDGYTQPGARPDTATNADNAVLLIAINGSQASAGTNGLHITADNTTVRGLVVYGFTNGAGIFLDSSSGTKLQGNFIGTGPNGRQILGPSTGGNILEPPTPGPPLGNRIGIYVYAGCSNLIGGNTPDLRNIISGNANDAVELQGPLFGPSLCSGGNAISGNFIGTDATGTNAVRNGGYGIEIGYSDSNLIGGLTPAPGVCPGNVISSNQLGGVDLSTSANVIQGNICGLTSWGNAALGNGDDGIRVAGTGNLIGGETAGAANILSGNDGYGVELLGGDNFVQGNFIGSDITGSQGIGNAGQGVEINNSANNQIGDSNPAGRNVISSAGACFSLTSPACLKCGATKEAVIIVVGGGGGGSGCSLAPGLEIDGSGASGNQIQGNLIGTQADGFSPLPNSENGIVISGGNNNLIGGTNDGAGNVIAYNISESINLVDGASDLSDGITIISGTGNAVLRNSVFANGYMGINLGNNGFVSNHLGTASGPNNLQNYPILLGATNRDGEIQVFGTVNSLGLTTYRLEFFSGSHCDGQGETFLGTRPITTDAGGNASFSTAFPLPVSAGSFLLTATATDPGNNTSEFSPAIPIIAAGRPRDLALIAIHAPRRILMNSSTNSTVMPVIVQIRNQGPQPEVIPDLATLSNLVTLSVQSRGTCPAPIQTLIPPSRFPLVLAPNQTLPVIYEVTFNCINDPAPAHGSDPAHADFSYSARVDLSALGGVPDGLHENDTCPRNAVHCRMNHKLNDQGCAQVLTDLVLR
jgi:hypothetical protein